MTTIFFHLWACCFLAAGALCIGLAIRNWVKGVATHGWKQTQCTITRSFLLLQVDDDNRKSITPTVEYEYQFEGNSYKGSRMRYGQTGARDRKSAEKSLGTYAVGTSMPVFVNPMKPRESVLLVGTPWANVLILAAGAVFTWSGYMLWQVKK
jgi:hypothetical protein